MELLRALRIDLAQLSQQSLAADLIVALIQLLPQRGVGRAVGKRAAGNERVDIQPRTADDDRQLSARDDIVHAGGGLRNVARHGIVLLRLGHVDHMVRHAAHFLRRRLRGADVHPAIDLH